MADDIVPLGFDVDTSGLAKAKGDAASAGTEISKLGDVIDKLTQVINTQNALLKQNAQALASVSTATKSAGDSTKAAATDVTGLANALKAVDDTTKKTAADVGALASALKPLDENAKKAAADMAELLNVQKQALAVSQQHMQQTTGLSNQFSGLSKQLLSLATAHSTTAKATRAAADESDGFVGKLGMAQGAIGKISAVAREAASIFGIEAGHGGGAGSLTGALGMTGEGLEGVAAAGGLAIGVIAGVAATAVAAAAAYAGAQAVLAHYQDEVATMTAGLKVASGSQVLANQLMGEMVTHANAAGLSIEAYTEQFSGFERIRESIGLTTAEVFKFTDALSKIAQTSGANPTQIEFGLRDFKQGLASGDLNGRSLYLMQHELPALGQAIERGNNWMPGSLKTHSELGQLTPQSAVSGLMAAGDQIDQSDIPQTVSRATQRLKNDATAAAAELGKVTGATQFTQGAVNMLDDVVAKFYTTIKEDSPDEQVNSLQMKITAMKAAMKADPGAGPVSLEQRAMLAQYTAQLEAAKKKQDELNKANGKDGTVKGDASVEQADNLLAKSDAYAKKLGELNQQLRATQSAMDAVSSGQTKLSGQDAADKVTHYANEIARMREELENAAPAFEKLQKKIEETTSDAASFGFGGGLKIGDQVRKLQKDNDAKGLPPLPTDKALGAVFDDKSLTMSDEDFISRAKADAARQKAGAVGMPQGARTLADVNAESGAWAKEQYGDISKYPLDQQAKITDQVKQHTDAMLAEAQAQDSVTNATARFAASQAYAVAKAGYGAAGQGAYAMKAAEERARAANEDLRSPGTGSTQLATWNLQEQSAVKSQLADAQRTAQELRDEIANAGHPNSLTAVKSQFSADKIRRSTAPGAAQDALVDDTMNAPQLQQEAKLAEQTAEMQKQLMLEQQKAAIYAKGGQDMDEQLAVAQKRFELEQQGITPSNQYYQTQIALTAELAKQTREMEQQKSLTTGMQKVFGDITKTIGTDLLKTFDSLFTTTGSKTKALMQGIAGMAKDVSNTIIQDLIIKPFEQLASQYGSSLIQKFLSSFAGGGSDMSTLGLGTSMGMDTAGAGAGMVGSNPYNFSMPAVANAKGGAYDSPSLSSFSGQVLNKPTFFAFASGAGVAGEAGPEGILPLARGADGSLGVRQYGGGASSGGGGSSNITIVDQRTASGSQPVQTSSGTDSNGQQFIRVLIRDTVKGGMASGDYDSTMKNNFQATRPLTKR